MLSSIAAALVGVWFYSSAPRSGRPPFFWAVSGVVVYFLAALLWSMIVTPGVKDTATHTQSGLLIFIVRYAYIVIGVACAAGINFWLNKAQD
jgi:hypothetical protein